MNEKLKKLNNQAQLFFSFYSDECCFPNICFLTSKLALVIQNLRRCYQDSDCAIPDLALLPRKNN